ncbi:MAG: gamma-glutamyl-gamma-aminobutyrate hydrolase family protein [Proteobacteria bacterium]|nr:gamma-glutamyl-gamma-aminobutyrate hydrolase family protein [Pseudomonadota bacterium]
MLFLSKQKSIFKQVLKITLFVIFGLTILFFINTHLIAKTSHNEKPLIGILLNDGGKGGYSDYPWYAMRKNYSQVVAQLGGVPVFIGHDKEPIEDYLKILDGVVLTGGDFYSPPEAFTTGVNKDYNPKYHPREYIEFALIKKGYDSDLPILGICAGMQQMNIALGGTIFENLKKSLGTPIQHRNETRHEIQHMIDIAHDSKLYDIMQTERLAVNSNHNAGINKIAPKLKVVALAPDGVIESFEAKNKKFFVGVMWHPEYVLSEEEKKLWIAFIDAAKEHRLNK